MSVLSGTHTNLTISASNIYQLEQLLNKKKNAAPNYILSNEQLLASIEEEIEKVKSYISLNSTTNRFDICNLILQSLIDSSINFARFKLTQCDQIAYHQLLQLYIDIKFIEYCNNLNIENIRYIIYIKSKILKCF